MSISSILHACCFSKTVVWIGSVAVNWPILERHPKVHCVRKWFRGTDSFYLWPRLCFFTYSKKKHGGRRRTSLSKLVQKSWSSCIKCKPNQCLISINISIYIFITDRSHYQERATPMGKFQFLFAWVHNVSEWFKTEVSNLGYSF